MTPEQRAKTLLRKIDACDCIPCCNEAAAAIRSAHNDAIEKAAKVAEREIELGNGRVRVAAAIRKLASSTYA
jgi:hypothetical protein